MQGETGLPALILFAKSPVPGRAKTRLMPQLTARQAAEVAAALIEQTAHLAASNWPGTLRLDAWPDVGHPVIQRIGARLGIPLAVQPEGHLGRKMSAAISGFTDAGIPAAVMGCDVPQCPGWVLRRAHELLQEGRDVIGPSRDGGYYMIGLTRSCGTLFEDIPWGEDGVLSATLRAAECHGISFEHLPSLTDIDNFQDLQRVSKIFPQLRIY